MAKKHHNGGGGGGGSHDTMNRQTMAQEYGFALAFMNSNPEIKHLFNQAVAKTWTADEFIARLRGTKWFKTHSSAVRNAIMQKTSDPSTWQANLEKMQSTIKDEWGKLFGGQPLGHGEMAKWANLALTMGWSEGQVIDHIANSVNYRKMLHSSALGGTAAETEAQLDQLIQDYGVDLGNRWKAGQLKNIIEGNGTINGIQNQVRELAKRQYKAFADEIDGGKTVAEIADPYVQKMSDLLEMNPNSVSVKNHMIQKALTATTRDGKPAAMSLTAFADMVRQDPRWQHTDNAKQQVADVTSQLLQSFGLMA